MKIAVIHWGCVHHDAISASVREHTLWLRAAGHETYFVGESCAYPELPFMRAATPAEALELAFVRECDLAVFHFGIVYALFDLLTMPRGRSKRLVVFHNITPADCVPQKFREQIERSFRQMRNIAQADYVISVSGTNRDVLREAGLDGPGKVLPLPFEFRNAPPGNKPGFGSPLVRLAFLGRFVFHKGPCDLLEALSIALAADPALRVELTMLGNLGFSDPDVLAETRERIRMLEETFLGRAHAALRGDVNEEEKARVLAAADIFALPTRHEGFCVPVLEALAGGCRVISYANSNVPAISGGLARLVPTGDLDALSRALAEEAALVRSAGWQDEGYSLFTQKAAQHLEQYQPERIRKRFLEIVEESKQWKSR
ncbi:MAG: glycosyltransferase family 4 protein [Deltaproteobacteria bacterium]|jgi:glycosyltransferase involved in cell wall biosynthesis|nr:glycosyltransferase family 4 protein [Deltaproteobacteria bacterium]